MDIFRIKFKSSKFPNYIYLCKADADITRIFKSAYILTDVDWSTIFNKYNSSPKQHRILKKMIASKCKLTHTPVLEKEDEKILSTQLESFLSEYTKTVIPFLAIKAKSSFQFQDLGSYRYSHCKISNVILEKLASLNIVWKHILYKDPCLLCENLFKNIALECNLERGFANNSYISTCKLNFIFDQKTGIGDEENEEDLISVGISPFID